MIVLFSRIHGLDVQCAIWSSQIALGAQKGGGYSLKFLPPSPLFATEKNVSRQIECIERSKTMYGEVFLSSVPFRSKHFDAFWHFLSF